MNPTGVTPRSIGSFSEMFTSAAMICHMALPKTAMGIIAHGPFVMVAFPCRVEFVIQQAVICVLISARCQLA
jgi:hypothetical protein